jgi:hypothetical protein
MLLSYILDTSFFSSFNFFSIFFASSVNALAKCTIMGIGVVLTAHVFSSCVRNLCGDFCIPISSAFSAFVAGLLGWLGGYPGAHFGIGPF